MIPRGPGENSYKRDTTKSVRTKEMMQRLAWLTTKVQVQDPLRDLDALEALASA
jgi:hypothetical protein